MPHSLRREENTLQPEPSAWTVNSAAVVNLEPPTNSKTGSLVTVREPSSCQCFCCVSLIVKVLVPALDSAYDLALIVVLSYILMDT